MADAQALTDNFNNPKKVKDNVMYFALLDKKSHLCVYPIKIDKKLEEVYLDYIRETEEYYNN